MQITPKFVPKLLWSFRAQFTVHMPQVIAAAMHIKWPFQRKAACCMFAGDASLYGLYLDAINGSLMGITHYMTLYKPTMQLEIFW